MILFMQAKDRPATWPVLPQYVLAEIGKSLVSCLREWRQRSRVRAELAAFDARMLRDIGITRCDAIREISKPFWRE